MQVQGTSNHKVARTGDGVLGCFAPHGNPIGKGWDDMQVESRVLPETLSKSIIHRNFSRLTIKISKVRP